jgi:branched-chain amino acid transport system permease protein
MLLRTMSLLASLRTPRGLITALLLIVLAVLPLLTQAFDQRYLLSIGTRIVIWAIAAVSLNMILGYGGMVSFGHAVFFGIGGYAVGILSHHGVASGWIQWPVAIVAATLWAALVGALSLRTRGLYFIMITLAFAQLVFYVGGGLEAYGADDGLNISRSRFPGLLDLRDKASFYWLCFALLCGYPVVLRPLRQLALRPGDPRRQVQRAPHDRAGLPGVPLSARRLHPVRCLRRPGRHPARQRRRLHLTRHDVVGEVGRPHVSSSCWAAWAPCSGRSTAPSPSSCWRRRCRRCSDLLRKGWGEYWQIVFGPLLVLVALYAKGGIDSGSDARRHG